MSETPDIGQYIITRRAHGKMAGFAAAEVSVRDFPPLITDEPSSAGGEDRGPTPLEYILIGFCG